MGNDAMTGPLRLDHLRERLRAGDPDAAREAASILDGPAVDIAAAVAARYVIIRAAAASLPSGWSVNAKAMKINSVFQSYWNGRWRRECGLPECPARLKGLERFAWHALREFDSTVGLSARSIRKMLAASEGDGQL
jgi:hypothetical protein